MNEMIERVARAICERHHLTWDCFGETAQKMYRDMARAAIQAMREPEPEMVEAAETVGIGPRTAKEVWSAMYEAALKEITNAK